VEYNTVDDVLRDLEENPVERSGNIYHPIPFPEFSHLKISSNKDVALKKLHLIEDVLAHLFTDDFKGRKLLDVGANAGLYTFSFAKKGMSVTAFEPHPRYAPIGSFLAKEKKLDIAWHGIPFDETLVAGQKFDVAIMMSVFQWMAAGEGKMDRASEQLRYISEVSSNLVFELGFNSGKSCIETKRINHYAELIKLLQRCTNYQYYKMIGKTNAWGGRKDRFMVVCSNDEDLNDSSFRKLIRHLHI